MASIPDKFVSKRDKSCLPGIVYVKYKNGDENSTDVVFSEDFKTKLSFDSLSSKEVRDLNLVKCNNIHKNGPKVDSKSLSSRPCVENSMQETASAVVRDKCPIVPTPDTQNKAPVQDVQKDKALKIEQKVSKNDSQSAYKFTHAAALNLFFLRSEHQENLFKKMSEDLKVYCQNSDTLIKPPVIIHEEIYVESVGGVALRVKAISGHKNRVSVIDIGKEKFVKLSNLALLSNEFRVPPPLASAYALSDVDTSLLSNDQKNKIRNWLVHKIKDTNLRVKFHKRNTYSQKFWKNFVEIYDNKGNHINELTRQEIKNIIDVTKNNSSHQNKCFMPWSREPPGPSLPQPPVPRMVQPLGPRMAQPPLQQRSPWVPTNVRNGPWNSSQFSAPFDPSYSASSRGPLLNTPNMSLYQKSSPPLFKRQERDQNMPTDEYMAMLEGQRDAFVQKIKTLEERASAFTEVQQCLSRISSLMDERRRLDEVIGEDRYLPKAIKYLFNDKMFHSRFDDVLQSFQTMERRSRRDIYGYKRNIGRLEELLGDLEFDKLMTTIKELVDGLKSTLPHQTLASYEANICDENVFRIFIPPYTAISKDFLLWKKEYLETQEITDAALRDVAAFFGNIGNHIMSVLETNDTDENFDFTKLDLKKIKELFDVEQEILDKGFYDRASVSVVEELDLRHKKLKSVRQYAGQFNLLYLIEKEEEDSRPVSEDDYPTLLKYISHSKLIKGSTKRLVIQDIVAEIDQLHNSGDGEAYTYINPQNIIMNEGAKLRKMSKLFTGEPVLPVVFKAPEYTGCDEKDRAEPSADIFSLGQLMMWLACIDAGFNSGDRIKQYKATVPLLKELVHEDPGQRPVIIKIRDTLPKMLPILFGIEGADEPIESVNPEVSLLVSDPSSAMADDAADDRRFVKTVLQEEEEIFREMMDSDLED